MDLFLKMKLKTQKCGWAIFIVSKYLKKLKMKILEIGAGSALVGKILLIIMFN